MKTELSIDFSRVREVELPELVQLVNSAYRGDGARRGWTSEADYLTGQRIDLQMLQEAWSDPSKALLRGRDEDERLLSCVLVEKEMEGLATLGLLTVDPTRQTKGLGGAQLAFAEKFVRQHWASRRIEMTVISLREELISWYERRGYLRTGEHRPFPIGESRFGVPQVSDLEFVVLEKEDL